MFNHDKVVPMCLDTSRQKGDPTKGVTAKQQKHGLHVDAFCCAWFAFGYFGIVLITFCCYVSAGWPCSDFQGDKSQQLLLLELEELELLLQLQAKQAQQQQKQEQKPVVPAYCLQLGLVVATTEKMYTYIVCMLISSLAAGPDNVETQIAPEMFATETLDEDTGPCESILACCLFFGCCLCASVHCPVYLFAAERSQS